MVRVHTAYSCDICGAGLVDLPGQGNNWETFSSSVLTFVGGTDYNDEDFLDIDLCGRCAAKVRNAIVSLQRDNAINAS